MTQPTVIYYFGPGYSRVRSALPLPKVYLRTLLFATSKRGRVIESCTWRFPGMRPIRTSAYALKGWEIEPDAPRL
jgi:hypothetical protein